MAPAPAAPERRGGLNLANPGAKEYLIIGGVALGLGLVYFWWKGRHTPAAASPAAGTRAPATATGLNTSAFSAWIIDHMSGPGRPPDRDRDPDREHEDRDDRQRRKHKRDDDDRRDVNGRVA